MSDRPPSTPGSAGPRRQRRPGNRGLAGVSPGSLFRSPMLLLLVIIVVGSVSLMAAGFGTPPPATDDNESKAPIGAIEDNSDDVTPDGDGDSGVVALSLSVNRSEIRPGDAVLATVTADGDPLADALVSVRGETYRTNATGTTALRLAEGGEASLRATKAGEGNSYAPATATVQVRRYERALSVSANATEVTAGETVAFTVETANGTTPAAVRVEGTTHRTGPDGVVAVSMDRAGAFTARATKPVNATVRYVPAEVDVVVERRTVALLASVGDEDVVAGEQVGVTVTRNDTDDTVAGARVVLDGVEYATNETGVVTVTFERARSATLSVTAQPTPAARFVETEVGVDVRRRAVALSVSANRSVVDTGDTVGFAVRRADTDEPANATLTVDGTAYATGPDGRVNVTLSGYGRVEARATRARTPAERYVPDTTGVTVLAPDFVVRDLALPPNATAGASVTVGATVQNVGNDDGSATVALRVAGETLTTRSVSLLPSEESRLNLSAEVPATATPGETTVTVVETAPPVGSPDGANGTLTVFAPEFAVSDLDAPDAAEPGETISVSGTVRNTGTAAGTTTVSYRFAGEVLATETVSLSPGGLARVRLNATVPADASAGEYDHALVTPDDEDSATLVVEDAAAAASDRESPPTTAGTSPTIVVSGAVLSY